MRNPQTVPDLFQKTKEDWLDGARSVAVKMLKTRQSITIEDVLDKYPRPSYLHVNTTGSVFHDDHFVRVGFAYSRRRTSHGRLIRRWSLRDEYIQENEEDCD